MATLTKGSKQEFRYTGKFPSAARSEPKGATGAALNDVFENFNRASSGNSIRQSFPNEAIDHIIDVIAKSKRILSLGDNWDDAGSPGYKENTWDRAKDFLLTWARDLWLPNRIRLDTPRILPGPDGSMDIHWKTEQRELLVNIPEDPTEVVRYYGDNRDGQVVKGNLNTSVDSRWLMMWLMQ